MSVQEEDSGGRALALITQIVRLGIEGNTPGLKSSFDLAHEYLADPKYPDCQARVKSLIRWESSKAFTSGFATGFGGFAAMPVTIPAAVGAGWVLQARLAGAIAVIHGHDIDEDRVRTLALLAIVGDTPKEAGKRLGIDLATKAGKAAIKQIPGKVLIDINKQVGFRLITKAGTRGVVNLTELVPILGGFVGGGVDLAAIRVVGRVANESFTL